MKNIAVFLSARELENNYYHDLTKATAKMLAKKDHRIYYGAGFSGMMGVFAASVMKYTTRPLIGATTRHLLETEGVGADLQNTHITETMGERKDFMLYNADAIVVLPGGFGTMDELFESLTYNQLGLVKAPIIILDPELTKPLKEMCRIFQERGTISKADADLLIFVENTFQLKKELNVILRRK